jgi:predicted nucleotide-binding protein (sugar kinase/HSP70/actin superfamily)
MAGLRCSRSNFGCAACPNHCEVSQIIVEDEPPVFFGGRCDRYERKNTDSVKVKRPWMRSIEHDVPDYLQERLDMLYAAAPQRVRPGRPTIGLPFGLTFHDLYPFWATFFNELDFNVVSSGPSTQEIVRSGLESVLTEICFPLKVAHGHVLRLLEMGVQYIFVPRLVDQELSEGMQRSFYCPYVIEAGDILNAALAAKMGSVRLLKPVVFLRYGRPAAGKALVELGKSLGCSGSQVRQAVRKAWEAQDSFAQRLTQRGREVLANLPPGQTPVVVLGRSYNSYDSGLNLNLPRMLRKLGAVPIPMDYLPLDQVDVAEEWPDMYWASGQKIMAAARIVAGDPRLQAIYLTNFQCGPDSFILNFLDEALGTKRCLMLEVDEHSSDGGVATRVEAFLDSLAGSGTKAPVEVSKHKVTRVAVLKELADRVMYGPHMGDPMYALLAGAKMVGMMGHIHPPSDAETLRLGRKYTSGRECYPCVVTTGDMLRLLNDPAIDPAKVAFCMPRAMGPCRLGMYHRLQRRLLDSLGYEDVPIFSPNQATSFYRELGGVKLIIRVWRGMVAIDCLGEALLRIRPYEREKGQTDRAYQECMRDITESMQGDAKEFYGAAGRCRRMLAGIPVTNGRPRPRIGVAGEIFVRNNTFCNNDLIRRIEELGGEAVLPPVHEWFLHTNATRKMDALAEKAAKQYFNNAFLNFFQERIARRIRGVFKPVLSAAEMPSTQQLWTNAEPYVIRWFGEAALTVGNIVFWAQGGHVDAVVTVMPFSCMIGTVVNSVTKSLEERYGLPCLSIAYDGLTRSFQETLLMTLIHRVQRRLGGEKDRVR